MNQIWWFILSLKFSESVSLGYINKASTQSIVGNAFKDVASIVVAIDYQMKQIKEIQDILTDPEVFERMKTAQQNEQFVETTNEENKNKEEE